jgi:hypothetical protein
MLHKVGWLKQMGPGTPCNKIHSLLRIPGSAGHIFKDRWSHCITHIQRKSLVDPNSRKFLLDWIAKISSLILGHAWYVVQLPDPNCVSCLLWVDLGRYTLSLSLPIRTLTHWCQIESSSTVTATSSASLLTSPWCPMLFPALKKVESRVDGSSETAAWRQMILFMACHLSESHADRWVWVKHNHWAPWYGIKIFLMSF